MDKYRKIAEEEFKELLEEIYIIGQDSKIIEISDFIRVVENKILSLLVSKV